MLEPPPPLRDILATLYASEINGRLESFWDGGFRVWIGDHVNGRAAEGQIPAGEAGTMSMWFIQNATAKFPESGFAKCHPFATLAPPSRNPW